MKPKSRLSIFRSIRGLRALLLEHELSAETLIGTALSLWCGHDFRGLRPSTLSSNRALRTTPELIAFVDFLRKSDFLEATYWLSSAYAMLADESDRKLLAMFFTPPSLTKGLLNDLQAQGADFAKHTFFDPACGGAAFLAPIALRMRDVLKEQGKSPTQILVHIETHLFGVDLEPVLCELSRHFLRMALHDEITKSDFLPYFKVTVGDSLLAIRAHAPTYEVVVCNPPYRKMSADELEPIRDSYKEIIEGQPNIYALFIVRCVSAVGNGGLVGLVTPTSFLSGQYFSKLRTFLMANTSVAHLGMVSQREGVFIDVEQETALCVLKRHETTNPDATSAKVSVVSAAGVYADVGACQLPNSGAAWPVPRAPGDVKLLEVAAHSRFRLSDYGYRVRIGLFVWNRDKRPSFASKKLAKSARAKTAVPLIWSKDIVIQGQTGKVKFLADDSNTKIDAFVDLGGTAQPGIIRRPSVVLQRVTSNDQPLRLVAAAVPKKLLKQYGGFVGENHIVILEQEADDPKLTPTQLARVLRSAPIDRYFRCISGATNVSVFELGQLVLPDPAVLSLELQKPGSVDAAVRRAFRAGARESLDVEKKGPR